MQRVATAVGQFTGASSHNAELILSCSVYYNVQIIRCSDLSVNNALNNIMSRELKL